MPKGEGRVFCLSLVITLVILYQLSGTVKAEANKESQNSQFDFNLSLRKEGKFEEAIRGNHKNLDASETKRNPSLEMRSLEQLGFLYLNIGDIPKSINYFEKLKHVAKSSNDSKLLETAKTALDIFDFYNKGKRHRSEGEHGRAIEAFESAISLSKSIGSLEHELKCSRQLSLVYYDLGSFKEFFNLNDRVLTISRAIRHESEEARALNNIGLYYWKVFNYDRALKSFENALKIIIKKDTKADQSDILHNIGLIYSEVGEYRSAIHFLSEALKINNELFSTSSAVKDLIAIGITYRRMAISQNREDYFSKALDIYFQTIDALASLNDERTRVMALNSIGNIYSDLGRYPEALRYFQDSLAIAEAIADEEAVGMILNNIGIVYSSLGQYAVSTDYFQRAIDRGLQIGGGNILWEAYLEIANVYRKRGETGNAILNYKNSISIIEDIRSQIKLEELRASYLGTDKRLEAYHNLIDLLAERSRASNDAQALAETFEFLERGRARAFLDSLEVSKISVSRGVDPQLLNRERELMSDVSTLYTRLLTAGLTTDEKSGLSSQIRELENRIETLKTEIRAASPAYAGLKYPQILTLTEAKRLIDRRTICLSYSLGTDRSWGFALSRDGLAVFPLPSRLEIQRIVSDYLKIITDKDARGIEAGHELYRMLVAPGIAGLPYRIIVIPEDILFLLPFETLVTDVKGPRWLIEKTRISYVPSLSSLRGIKLAKEVREGRRSKDLLAFGDPELSLGESAQQSSAATEALTEIFPSLPFQVEALRFSRPEVEGIAASFNPRKTTLLFGRDATEDALKALPLNDYKVVHFATHSLIDDSNPARSSILLALDPDPAEDGLFQMREVFDLNLRADLVTLSGCRTGLGPFIRGEGIDSLSRAFFYAGASSVLMSLWAVDDEASAHLMTRIYAQLRSGRPLEEALRNAQLEMINSEQAAHPYYWGGFVATGVTNEAFFSDRWWREPIVSLFLLYCLIVLIIIIKIRQTIKRIANPRAVP